MKVILRRSIIVYFLIGVFVAGLGVLVVSWATSGRDWVMNTANGHIYSGGQLQQGGNITDRSGNILAQTVDGKRVYNADPTVRTSLLHTVGDTEMFISASIQRKYSDALLGYNIFTGVHTASAGNQGNNIKLTVDADVCATALQKLNGRKGAVAVYNYKTGEILCSVSTPGFDPQNKPQIDAESDQYDGVYINRVLSGRYPPGSTFKVVTAAAALEAIPDLRGRTFTCTGKFETGVGAVICNSTHGNLNFDTALNVSCNSVFAQLSLELGAQRLTQQAERMGFNKSFSMGNIKIAKSSFDVSKANKADLGWAGIGQYTTLVTPYHMMTIMGAIGAGGQAATPYLVDNVTLPFGVPIQWHTASKGDKMLDSTVAGTLGEIMHQNVVKTYGQKQFGSLDVAAKTGTAEIGGGKEPHSWFAGFVRDESCPLAFAVVVENGDAGMKAAGPIAAAVLLKANEKLNAAPAKK